MNSRNNSIDDALNILLLGDTGVGKSTWINAFANYLHFKTLDEAQAAEPVCLIPTKFSILDDYYEIHTIQCGECANKSFNCGQSTTERALSYVFNAPEGKIRIIDTPATGDSRGPDQEDINLENVLRYISQLPQLHGICILLKPNVSRLTILFRYCINKLLTHLHRNAATNIIFCFTNARATFYQPGDTVHILRVFLDDLERKQGIKIPASSDTLFCWDNEAFRFLLAYKAGFKCSEEDDIDRYRQSWTRSQTAIKAMIQRIKQLNPHQLQDTVTINNARRIILALVKPLADITNNIQLNKKLLHDQQEELKRHKGTYDELKAKLIITQVDVQTKQLEYPRTVCTAPGCVDIARIKNTEMNQTIYKSHCHPHCHCNQNVQKDQVPNPDLKECKAMDDTLFCKKCSCEWYLHMYINYEQTQVSIQAEDPFVKDAIEKNLDEKTILQTALKAAEAKQNQLEQEHQHILASGAKFGAFLKENALKPYNDAIKNYLEYSIKEEERLIASDKTNLVKLEAYKTNLQIYEQEKAILDNAIKSGAEATSADDVMKIIDELKNLPINGQTFKDLLQASVIGEMKSFAYNENHYDPATGRFGQSSIELDFVN